MEHIKEAVDRLSKPSTLHQKNSDTQLRIEEEPRNELLEKLRRFNLSTLEHTFENFKQRRGTTEAYSALLAMGNGESNNKFVLIYGSTGCGKTHLIEATIIAWAKRGIATRYQTMSEMSRKLKSAVRANIVGVYDELFRFYCERDKLIIDDYGMGMQETRFEVSDLEDIVDVRYHHRFYPDDKVTIMATNKNINDIPERILSRFCDPEFGAVVFMNTSDYRRRKV